MEDKKRVYDWVYSANGSWIGIDIFLADFDNDGTEELAVTCVEGTGTGCYIMDLYMVEIYETVKFPYQFNDKEMFTSVLMVRCGDVAGSKFDSQ